MTISDPSQITTAMLKLYYMRLNGTAPKVKGQTLPPPKSEATARTYVTRVVMRHSFASHLANGGVGVAQLSAWTGDRIATLEKHYLHPLAEAEKAEAAFAGETTQSALIRRMDEFIASQARESRWQDADGPETSGDGGELLSAEKLRKRKFEEF